MDLRKDRVIQWHWEKKKATILFVIQHLKKKSLFQFQETKIHTFTHLIPNVKVSSLCSMSGHEPELSVCEFCQFVTLLGLQVESKYCNCHMFNILEQK